MASPRSLLSALVALAACLTVPAAAGAATPTVWLCNPVTKSADPCRAGLDATRLAADGRVLGVERAARARRPAVDCFYVYPTVSDQKRPQATLAVDPEQRAIATFQASRYSQVCRVFAPMYRQLTLQALLNPATITAAMRASSYADVRAAWREYLRRHNRGRGVLLIGHSQGTFMLRRLIAEELDRSAPRRRQLVAAHLIGGNVTVRRGRDVGGDFRRIPTCRRAGQTGCVVAYSLFGGAVPADTRFGLPTNPVTREREDATRYAVACTNPGALLGGAAKLASYVPTAAFPGTIGALVNLQLGALPKVGTPWIAQPASYTGQCTTTSDGASVLLVRTARGARALQAVPDPSWGLHLADMNLPMGNLVAVARQQIAAFGR